MVILTSKLLADISGAPEGRMTDELVSALNRTMVRYGINTIKRQAHFLGQLIHESGAFRYTEEIASGEAYEGRLDLGNTEPGDGPRFKGRGLIQVTGRSNYTAYGMESGYDFLLDPKELADFPHAALSAGWFWRTRNLNDLADKDDTVAVTRRINGGTNGLEERIKYTKRAESHLTMERERTMARPLKPLPPDPLPTVPIEVPDPRPAPPSPDDPHYIFPKKPKWIGFSKTVGGIILMLVGVFGKDVGIATDLLNSTDEIIVIVGAIVALVGRVFAKEQVYLWPEAAKAAARKVVASL